MTATVQKRGELATGYLTQREVDVLRHVAAGCGSREIGASLGVSWKTVDRHRGELCRKLRARSAADLTRHAIERGVVTVDVQPLKRVEVHGCARYLL